MIARVEQAGSGGTRTVELSGSYLGIAERIGLREHDILYLASDIARLARKAKRDGEDFSVDAWVDSFLRAMPNGTLVVPAFTDDLTHGDTFDRTSSKPTTGAVSNRVMKRPDVVRTRDPLHSVFAIGKHKEEIASLADPSTFGENSIFGYLHRKKAKMLVVDVDFQYSFTFIHYLEEKWKVGYRKHVEWSMRIRDGNSVSKQVVRYFGKRIGVSNDLHAYQRMLIEEGVVQTFLLDGIPMLFLGLDEVAERTRTYFANGGRVHRFSWAQVVKTVLKRLLPMPAKKR